MTRDDLGGTTDRCSRCGAAADHAAFATLTNWPQTGSTTLRLLYCATCAKAVG